MFWKEKEAGRRATAGAAGTPPGVVSCPLLRPFLGRIARVQPAPSLLLFGEMCGANVSYLGERGFRVSVIGTLQPAPRPAAAGDPSAGPAPLAGGYAGALVWDALSFVKPAEARGWVSMIAEALDPGGAVLVFFTPASTTVSCPRMRYRIVSDEMVIPERVDGDGVLPQPYQNREIIRLFDRFDLDLLHTHKNGQREALFFKGRPPSPGP